MCAAHERCGKRSSGSCGLQHRAPRPQSSCTHREILLIWRNVGIGEENVTALSHNTVFMGVQQLAMLAVHKHFFVRDYILPVAIRFEECFCPGDVIEPNLRERLMHERPADPDLVYKTG